MSNIQAPAPAPAPAIGPATKPISLDDLIALNEEIAALVRVGIPLEVGLGGGGELPRNLQAITERLRTELERGVPLPAALRACGAQLPPSYLALLEAGLKTNRLPDALASAAEFARALVEMQQSVRGALIYPTIVLAIAYGFLLVLLRGLLPRIADLLAQTNAPAGRLLGGLFFLSDTLKYWGPAVPVVALLAAMWTGILPLASARRPRVALSRLRWLPWLRRIVNDVQSASFCQLLGLLVEREIPFPEALELSATATADLRLRHDCHQLASDLRRGTPLQDALRKSRRLPPFLRWMLTAGEAQQALPSVMATLGEVYRMRARSQIELFRMSGPLILTVLLGGGAVIAYSLLLFLPMRNLFMELTKAG